MTNHHKKHTEPSHENLPPSATSQRPRRHLKDPDQIFQARQARQQRASDLVREAPLKGQNTQSETQKIEKPLPRRHPILNSFITAGTISLCFLIIYYAYRAGLLFAANRLEWEPAWWLIKHPDIYEKTIWGLIAVYFLALVIGIRQALKHPLRGR